MSEITTPIKAQVLVLKDSVTGYDQEQVNAARSTMPPEDSKLTPDEMANRRVIELCVLSVDGTSENILDRVLNMDRRDYQYVIGELNDLWDGPDEQKKTTLGSTIPEPPTASPSLTPPI